MAWFSSGKTNKEMVASLARNGILTSSQAIDAFTLVDRGDFVTLNDPTLVYRDAPLRDGRIHISAPHIYASIIEQMELREGLYFLNVGSGSGYFSTIVSSILGKTGINHGIEIDETLVAHASMILSKQQEKWNELQKMSETMHDNNINPEEEEEENDRKKKEFSKWLKSHSRLYELANTSYVCGNIFQMDCEKNMKYHRIYVGAEAPDSLISGLKTLLRADDGFMIVPNNGKICKIRRIDENTYNTTTLSCVMFAPLLNPQPIAADQQRICYFPEFSWSKHTRHFFPKQYKDVVNEIFRTCNDIYTCSNVLGLPTALWIHILSFAPSNWFDHIETPEESILKKTKLLMHDDEITKIVHKKQKEERQRFFDFVADAIYERAHTIYVNDNDHDNEAVFANQNHDAVDRETRALAG